MKEGALNLKLWMIPFIFTFVPKGSQGVACIHCFLQGEEVPYVPPPPRSPLNYDYDLGQGSKSRGPYHSTERTSAPPIHRVRRQEPSSSSPLPNSSPDSMSKSSHSVPSCGEWEAAGSPGDDPAYVKECPNGCKTEVYKVIWERFKGTQSTKMSSLQIYRRCRDDLPRGEECLDFTDVSKPYWIEEEERRHPKIMATVATSVRPVEQNVVSISTSEVGSTSTPSPEVSPSEQPPEKATMLWGMALVCGCDGETCNADAETVLDTVKEEELSWIRLSEEGEGNSDQNEVEPGKNKGHDLAGSEYAGVLTLLAHLWISL